MRLAALRFEVSSAGEPLLLVACRISPYAWVTQTLWRGARQ